MAFEGRLAALEGKYFREEQQLATRRAVERLIADGQLPKTALKALDEAYDRSTGQASSSGAAEELPITINRGNQSWVFQHKKGLLPVPRQQVSWSTLGTPVSFGRARWTVDDASIFSVKQGKELAQTPHNPPTFYERLRAEKQQRAALETPLVRGYRLLPEFTPGRAMLWGTILAFWGSAALVMSTARGLDIKQAKEAPEKLGAIFGPAADALARSMQPAKAWLEQHDFKAGESSEFANRLRRKLASPPSQHRQSPAASPADAGQ